MSRMMERYIAAIPKILNGKRRMVERNLMRAKAKCPICKKEELQLALAPNRRDSSGYHVRWHYKCGFQGME